MSSKLLAWIWHVQYDLHAENRLKGWQLYLIVHDNKMNQIHCIKPDLSIKSVFWDSKVNVKIIIKDDKFVLLEMPVNSGNP